MNNDRRRFLHQLGTTAVAAPALLAAQGCFARQLESLQLPGRVATDFVGLGRQYMLDHAVNYLNHASIGTMPKIVFQARSSYLRICEQNPWAYIWGGEWDDPREQVRQSCAELLNCRQTEIALTHNTTETFNVLAQGLPLGVGDEVLFSSLNHPGASIAFQHLAQRRGYSVKRFDFPVAEVPGMSSDDVVRCYVDQINERTKLLVFPHIDNIVGLRYPVAELARAARARGVDFIAVDGAQGVGMLPVNLSQLGVDVYAASPHKWLQAPKGLGLSFVAQGVQEQLHPMWVTWGQKQWHNTARKYEDYGTRNLAEVLTLGDAIAFQRELDSAQREQRLQSLWQYVKQRAQSHPATRWASPTDWALGSAICSIEINNENARALAQRLFSDQQVVLRPFTTQGINALRLSPNIFTSEAQVDQVFEGLATRDGLG